jgi:hypothetical protein
MRERLAVFVMVLLTIVAAFVAARTWSQIREQLQRQIDAQQAGS